MKARLGQHFLRDEQFADRIAAAAGGRPGMRILEIGPGEGALTRRLVESGAEVIAVELDEALARRLSEPGAPNLRIIRTDFLKLDLAALGAGPFRVVSNLPYAVGAPILQRVLEWRDWDEAVLMFQKEVAERVLAASGADYGLLSLSVRLFAQPEPLFDVPRESFSPRPRVQSAVVHLRRLPEPRLGGAERETLFRLARAAFAQRRKVAAGTIAAALSRPRAQVEAALERCGADPRARPERIAFESLLRLPRELSAG